MPFTIDQLEAYTKLGWKLFPLVPLTKRPLTTNGFYNATSNMEIIKTWFDETPNANWAAAMGEPSGICVVDIDIRGDQKNGFENFQKLIETYGKEESWPTDNPAARTAQEGVHLFFKYDYQRAPRRSKLTSNVDFMATGSYVVLAPSVVEIGGELKEYTWVRSPSEYVFPELPNWVYNIQYERRDQGKDFFGPDGLVPIGARHQYLVSVGGTLRRRGMPREVIEQMLLVAYDKMCEHGDESEPPKKHIRSIVDYLMMKDPEDPFVVDEDEVEITARMRAIESEGIVLNAIMNGLESNVAFGYLMEDNFLAPLHGRVFTALKDLAHKQVTPNLINLLTELRRSGQLGKGILIEDDIRAIKNYDEIYLESDLDYHVNVVIDAWSNRILSKHLRQAQKAAQTGIVTPTEIITDVSGKLLSMGTMSGVQTVYNPEQQRQAVEANLEKGEPMVEPFGWKSLDRIIKGASKSEIVVVAGRPGMGKTALALAIDRNFHYRWRIEERERGIEKACSMFFSAEMQMRKLYNRHMCSIGNISTAMIKEDPKQWSEDQWRRYKEAQDIYQERVNTIIDDNPAPSADYIVAKTLAQHRIQPVRAVFIDFVERLADFQNGRGSDLQINLTRAMSKLNALAKMIDAPVIILSQVKREVEDKWKERGTLIPQPGDLSWSDALTKLAEQIIFIVYPHNYWQRGIKWNPFASRPEEAGRYWVPDEPPKNVVILSTGKNRDGTSPLIRLGFNAPFLQYMDIEDLPI